MQAQADSGFQALFTHIVGDMAKAIGERMGEGEQQRTARVSAAVHMIMSFLPRDAIEAMLAGHCVMFHALLTQCIGESLRGEVRTPRGGHTNVLGMNRALLANLDQLTRYQRRAAEGSRDAPVSEAPAQPVARAPAQPVARAPAKPVTQAPAQSTAQPVAQTSAKPPAPPLAGERGETRPVSVFAPQAGMDAMPFHPSPAPTLTSTAAALAVMRAGDVNRVFFSSGQGQTSGATIAAASVPRRSGA